MTQETFEKAVSIQDDLTTYRKIQTLVNKGTVYMADADTVYNTALPDELLSCMNDFCRERICKLVGEFQNL